jgi:hypothetical protein
VLGRRPGVRSVDANPIAQTATISYDPAATSVAELAGWVRDCGYHCAGQSVPSHVCDPLIEPAGHRGHGEGYSQLSTRTPRKPAVKWQCHGALAGRRVPDRSRMPDLAQPQSSLLVTAPGPHR